MPKNIKFVIFDLDGVVADTEPKHRSAKLRIFAELGLKNPVDLDAHVGRPNSELWIEVIRDNNLDKTPAEMERMQYDYILEQLVVEKTPMSRGIERLLACLDAAGVPCGICSSSDRYYVDKVLAFFNLTGRFRPIVGGDEVPTKKPAPDGYLKLLRDAGVDAAAAVAIEDSRAGSEAATTAGVRCIGYANPTSGNQDLSLCFMKVNMLDEIAGWFKSHLG